MEKSVILTWAKENIDTAPEACGVFLLRSTPVNGDIVLIKETENLKSNLEAIFNEGKLENVKFFDWYRTDSITEAEQIKKDLSQRYHLEEVN